MTRGDHCRHNLLRHVNNRFRIEIKQKIPSFIEGLKHGLTHLKAARDVTQNINRTMGLKQSLRKAGAIASARQITDGQMTLIHRIRERGIQQRLTVIDRDHHSTSG